MSQVALDDAAGRRPEPPSGAAATGPTMLAALFVPHALIEMRSILEQCLADGWRIVVLLGYEGHTSGTVVDWAATRGLRIVRVPSDFTYGLEEAGATPPGWTHRLPGPAGSAVRAAWRLGDRVRWRRAALGWMRRQIADLAPDLMLTHNFRSAGRVDHALLRACRDAKLPSACLMVSPMVSRRISYMARVQHLHTGMCDPELAVASSRLNRVAARIWPSWVAWDGGVGVFDNHPMELLAARLSGLLPRDIWQVPPPEFDAIFAPTQRSRDRLVENGHDAGRVHCFGMPRMAEAHRLLADQHAIDTKYRTLGLPSGTPYVLWNMEPSWEHHYSSAEVHWERVEAIRGILERLGRPVVISLHPLCRLENYLFLEQTPNIRISRDHGINVLYPFAGFSISFGCSTDQFGEGAGKVVVFYDWTGISTHPGRWAEFQTAGMRVARDFATLETVVGEVAAQVDWQARLMARPGSQDAVARIGTALRRIAAGSRTAADRAHPTRLQDANT